MQAFLEGYNLETQHMPPMLLSATDGPVAVTEANAVNEANDVGNKNQSDFSSAYHASQTCFKLDSQFINKTVDNTGNTARDHLANERTFLAWLRTAITVSIASNAVWCANFFHIS